ncbi:MAG TPA: membrane lipoprotein lipid attachment site-containing protein [Devosiaceae bacterium]|jgi:predicted small secreted protein|nr:membrane lipoprotein lipid attachment site-containing protein [Devosiaceae bacterium]
MKKILVILVAALSLSACSTTEQGAGIGALTGGLVGAATTGSVAGAAIGAGVGAAAGAVLGHVVGEDGYCWYGPDRYHHGRWKNHCPRGY